MAVAITHRQVGEPRQDIKIRFLMNFRDHKNRRFSNDLPPRVKPVEDCNKPHDVTSSNKPEYDLKGELTDRSFFAGLSGLTQNVAPLKTLQHGSTGVSTGGVEPPTFTDSLRLGECSGVHPCRARALRQVRRELHSSDGCRALGTQHGEAAGLDPAVLHYGIYRLY